MDSDYTGQGALVVSQPAVVTSDRFGIMDNEKKSPDQILHTIEDTLEERKGRDRRKSSATDAYLNPALERRKGNDRRTLDEK
jgi:hypothetical protein